VAGVTSDLVPDDWPDSGQIVVSWDVSMIDGRFRLGWKYESLPKLDPTKAILLLRDVAGELEEDLPA